MSKHEELTSNIYSIQNIVENDEPIEVHVKELVPVKIYPTEELTVEQVAREWARKDQLEYNVIACTGHEGSNSASNIKFFVKFEDQTISKLPFVQVLHVDVVKDYIKQTPSLKFLVKKLEVDNSTRTKRKSQFLKGFQICKYIKLSSVNCIQNNAWLSRLLVKFRFLILTD